MKITVNSRPVEVPAGTTLATWLADSDYSQRKIALAVNKTFVPRQAREGTVLSEGDRVEVLEAFQGG